MKKSLIGLLGILLGTTLVFAEPGKLVSFSCEPINDKLLDEIAAGYSELQIQKTTSSGQKIILWDEAKSRITGTESSKELRIEVSY